VWMWFGTVCHDRPDSAAAATVPISTRSGSPAGRRCGSAAGRSDAVHRHDGGR
jgi:hypothetical protein